MAAPFNPPKKGEDFAIHIALEDMANPGSFKTNPTIVAGDFKVDKDGAGFVNLNSTPDADPAGSPSVLVYLDATEMNADNVTLLCVDQSTPKEWADFMLCIPTTQ